MDRLKLVRLSGQVTKTDCGQNLWRRHPLAHFWEDYRAIWKSGANVMWMLLVAWLRRHPWKLGLSQKGVSLACFLVALHLAATFQIDAADGQRQGYLSTSQAAEKLANWVSGLCNFCKGRQALFLSKSSKVRHVLLAHGNRVQRLWAKKFSDGWSKKEKMLAERASVCKVLTGAARQHGAFGRGRYFSLTGAGSREGDI